MPEGVHVVGRRVLAPSLALCALALLAAPASAATPITFDLAAGTLSISQPSTTASFGTATASATGTSVTGLVGTTTVTDTRGSLAGWTVSISSTDFSDGASHSIAATNAKAYVLAANGPTVTSGIAVPTTTYVSLATALTLSNTGQNFVTATATGSNVVAYNPTITVNIPSTAIAGTYTATLTQTVA